MTNTTPLLVVAAALVGGDGRVLVQRRPAGAQHGGLWEFPGGKIEPGERPEGALARELAEELAISVDPADCRPATFAGRPLGDRELILLCYIVRRWQGEPRALAADALAWTMPAALSALAMPPADVVLATTLVRLLDRGKDGGEDGGGANSPLDGRRETTE